MPISVRDVIGGADAAAGGGMNGSCERPSSDGSAAAGDIIDIDGMYCGAGATTICGETNEPGIGGCGCGAYGIITI